MNGWVRIYRRLVDHPLWLGHRFSPGQAWIDLILMANFLDSKALQGHRWIPVKRGQVLTSQVALSSRWQWNRKTVVRFLRVLKRDIMVDIETSKETDTGYTLITIRNYEHFQGQSDGVMDIQNDLVVDIGRDIEYPRIKKKKNKNKYMLENGLPQGFSEWWKEYPKKVGKIQTVKEWEKVNPDEELQSVIFKAIQKQKLSVKAMVEQDIAHVLDPERWIKYRRWEDEVEVKTEEYQRL